MVRPSVPQLCSGGTVACLASGPSLTRDDVNAVRGAVDAVIAINTTYTLAPWASALYAADKRWWRWHRGAPDFGGLKFTLPPVETVWPGVIVLKNTGREGLELEPTGLRTGRNSGHQAINLAVHFGAARILLLGYDCGVGPAGERQWHSEHPVASRPNYLRWMTAFGTLVEPLRHLGVEVINCSRQTALTMFPRMSLAEALTRKVAA